MLYFTLKYPLKFYKYTNFSILYADTCFTPL